MQDRVDELDASARRALDAQDVWPALRGWLELYDRCATEYPGMSARVGELLNDDSTAVGTMCGPMRTSFARLFERARREVPLRPGLTAAQLLSMIGALPKDGTTGQTLEPCLRVVLSGLRAWPGPESPLSLSRQKPFIPNDNGDSGRTPPAPPPGRQATSAPSWRRKLLLS
ncbi:MAG: hypothetical protein ACRDN0_08810, partial [Trebonia sp.]